MRVPRYEQQVGSLNVPSVAAPNIPIPDMSTSSDIQSAKNIQSVGATIGDIAKGISSAMQTQQDRANEQNLVSNFDSASQELNDSLLSTELDTIKNPDGTERTIYRGKLNRQLGDTKGISQEINSDAYRIFSKYESAFKDPIYQQKFSEMFAREFRSKRAIVNRHEATELQKNNDLIFDDTIKNKIKDAASIQNQQSAQDGIASIADIVSAHGRSNGWAPEVVAAKTRESQAKLIESAALGSLTADPTGKIAWDEEKKTGILAVNGLAKEDADDIKNKVSKASKEYQKQLKDQAIVTQDTNLAKISLDAFKEGKRLTPAQTGEMVALGGLRKEQKDSYDGAIKNMKDRSEGASNNGMAEIMDAIAKIENPVEQNERLMDVLNDPKLDNDTKSSAIAYLANFGSDKFANNMSASTKATATLMGLNADNVSSNFTKNMNSGMAPQEAADAAIQHEIMRNAGTNEKEIAFVNSAWGQFWIKVRNPINGFFSAQNKEPIPVDPKLSQSVYSYLVKTGTPPPDAMALAQKVAKSTEGAKTPLEQAVKFQEALDANVPQWSLTPEGQAAKEQLMGLVKMEDRGILGTIQYWGQRTASGVVRLGSVSDSVLEVALHKMVEGKSKELEKLGVSFGGAERKRTPKEQAKVDKLNKEIEGLWRQIDISRDAQKWWDNAAGKGILKTNESLYKDKTWVKFVGGALEGTPLMGLSSVVALTMGPAAGAAVFVIPSGAKKYNRAIEEGESYQKAQDIGLQQAVGEAIIFHYIPKAFEGVPGAAAALAKNGIAMRSVEVAGKAAEGAAVMGAATVYSNAVDILGFDDAISLTQGLGESLLTGALTVGAIGAFTPSRAREIARMKKEAEAKGVDVEALEEQVGKDITDPITAEKIGDDVYSAIVKQFPDVETKLKSHKKAQELVVSNNVKTGNEPDWLQYLSDSLGVDKVVRMTPEERIALSWLTPSEFRDYVHSEGKKLPERVKQDLKELKDKKSEEEGPDADQGGAEVKSPGPEETPPGEGEGRVRVRNPEENGVEAEKGEKVDKRKFNKGVSKSESDLAESGKISSLMRRYKGGVALTENIKKNFSPEELKKLSRRSNSKGIAFDKWAQELKSRFPILKDKSDIDLARMAIDQEYGRVKDAQTSESQLQKQWDEYVKKNPEAEGIMKEAEKQVEQERWDDERLEDELGGGEKAGSEISEGKAVEETPGGGLGRKYDPRVTGVDDKAQANQQAGKDAKGRAMQKWGEKNKYVTAEKAEAARKALREKLGGLHSGVDPTAIGDLTVLGAYHLEAGARKFSDWSAKMVEDLGERVKPYLDDIWDNVHTHLADLKAADKNVAGSNTLAGAEYGSGKETKQRGLAKNIISKAEEAGLLDKFNDIPEYDVAKNPENLAKALALPDEMADKIAMGEEQAPKGIIPEMAFVVAADRAQSSGNVEKVLELGTKSGLLTEATTMGQRIQALANLDPYGAVKIVQDVVRERAKNILPEVKKVAKMFEEEVKSEIKKASKSKVKDWEGFIRGLEC